MNDEIKETLEYKIDFLTKSLNIGIPTKNRRYFNDIKDYIINLQQENKIKDTNWESLKYYLEKLYYKDYIEEAISDDIDKKIKELESKVEIKGYQKDIKALQQENERLKWTNYGDEIIPVQEAFDRLDDEIGELEEERDKYERERNDYKSRCEKAVEYIKTTKFLYKSHYDFKQDLLNILQNGSEENNTNNIDNVYKAFGLKD